jgi:hypothetical protein
VLQVCVLHKLTDEDLFFKITEKNNSQLFALLNGRFSNVADYKYFGFAKNKELAEDQTYDIFIILLVTLKTFKRELKVY